MKKIENFLESIIFFGISAIKFGTFREKFSDFEQENFDKFVKNAF